MLSWQPLLLSLFVLILNSCGTPPPPNVEACARLLLGAQCAFTIDGPTRKITEADWLDMRLGRISFAPEDYSKIRRFIEIVCARYKDCKVKDLNALFRRMDNKLPISIEKP